MKIFSDFFASVSKLFDASDLRSFCDIAIATLLTLVRDTLILVVDLLGTFVEGILALGELASRGMKALLEQEPDLGWGFISARSTAGSRKGRRQSRKLTVANLMALMAAFPVTPHLQAHRGDGRAFPEGKYPSRPATTTLLGAANEDPTAKLYRQVCLTTSGVVAILGAAFDGV